MLLVDVVITDLVCVVEVLIVVTLIEGQIGVECLVSIFGFIFRIMSRAFNEREIHV